MLRVTLILGCVGCGAVKTDPPNVDAPDEPDTTAPIVTITQKPAAIDVGNATFEWVVDDATASFQCAIDDGSFADCTSPTMFAALGPGSHMFQVLATDAAGNTGSAMHAWAVEQPCTASQIEMEDLTPQPANWGEFTGSVLHAGKGLGTSVVNNTLTFTFTGKGLIVYTDIGPIHNTMEITIDNGTPVVIDMQAAGFAFQSPFPIASGLINVEHTVVFKCTGPDCNPDYVDVTCTGSD